MCAQCTSKTHRPTQQSPSPTFQKLHPRTSQFYPTDADEARSHSGSSASSSRSASSGHLQHQQRLRSSRQALLPSHTESDESNNALGEVDVLAEGATTSPASVSRKAFNVISAKSNPSRRSTSDLVSSLSFFLFYCKRATRSMVNYIRDES